MDSSVCIPTNKYMIFGVDMMVHVLILFTILAIFFMFISSKLEKKVLSDQITKNINDGMDDFIKSLTPKQKTQLNAVGKESSTKALEEKFQSPDKTTETNNKWLFRTITFTDIVLFLLTLTVVSLLLFSCNKCIDIKHILITNVITFLFIGIFEVVFFLNVGLKFIPMKPSLVSETFFNRLQHNLNKS